MLYIKHGRVCLTSSWASGRAHAHVCECVCVWEREQWWWWWGGGSATIKPPLTHPFSLRKDKQLCLCGVI